MCVCFLKYFLIHFRKANAVCIDVFNCQFCISRDFLPTFWDVSVECQCGKCYRFECGCLSQLQNIFWLTCLSIVSLCNDQKNFFFQVFNFLGGLTLVHSMLKMFFKKLGQKCLSVCPSVWILTLDFSRRLIDLGHSYLVWW
jgi:hypothetical protein